MTPHRFSCPFSPGDRQALPGFLDVLKSGKTNFQVGNNQNLFDWTYVDNVVHAHLIAAERLELTVPFTSLDTRCPPVTLDVPHRLLPTSTYRPPSLLDLEKNINPSFTNTSEPDAPLYAARNRFDQFYPQRTVAGELVPKADYAIAGQAFFITNGEPIYFWDFPRAIWAAYNGHEPSFVVPLPTAVGLLFASLGEGVGYLLGKTPNLTRGKVVYSTTHRYYNIEKVRLPAFSLTRCSGSSSRLLYRRDASWATSPSSGCRRVSSVP